MVILNKMFLGCNFECTHCYEHPIRPEVEFESIDYDAVEETIRRLYKEEYDSKVKYYKKQKKNMTPRDRPSIGMHGGEFTMLPRPIIERFLKMSFELTGRSSIQTNGYLIDGDMIRLFKKYNTGVGFSIDGPWPCNKLRGVGNARERKKQTKKIIKTLYQIQSTQQPKDRQPKDEDKPRRFLHASVIIVIHKENALGERREMLKNWILELEDKGIKGRMNVCCTENPKIGLTPEEATDFYTDMYDFMAENGITGWAPFRDFKKLMEGKTDISCKFKECDPFCTSSATTVHKDGSVGVCLRLYSDGKRYLRQERVTDFRGNLLRQTDCEGCEWWEYCHGGCAGTAVGLDWRNKDRYCEAYKALFEKARNNAKFLGVFKPIPKRPVGDPDTRWDGDHTDGHEHLDGNTRYLDSGLVS